VVCDENGIGGSGEYFDGNDAHLRRINVVYHGASGCKCASRAMLFDLEPGVIDASTLSRRSAGSYAWKPSGTKTRARETTRFDPPSSVATFIANSKPHTGHVLGPFVCGARACIYC
jgi:hypothetical protein